MLKDNLIMLRNLYGYSQEAISEKIGISRQAYAKWESGATVPDIEKCSRLAEVYGTTIDRLVNEESKEDLGLSASVSRGKNIWGSVAISEKGQIVIPKGLRDQFGLTGGQRLIVLSNEEGIALIPDEAFLSRINEAYDPKKTN